MYVYKQTEPQLYTVGYYTPDGEWMPESDHDNTEEASKRVNYLNGAPQPCICKRCDGNSPSGVYSNTAPVQIGDDGTGSSHEDYYKD